MAVQRNCNIDTPQRRWIAAGIWPDRHFMLARPQVVEAECNRGRDRYMSDMNGDKQAAGQVRRKFLKGAAVAGVAAAGYLVNFNAPGPGGVQGAAAATAQQFSAGRRPYNTPVPDMLTPQAAALLTPAAAKLNKGHLLHLRNAVKGKNHPNTPQSMTAADLSSIEAAFDTHENGIVLDKC